MSLCSCFLPGKAAREVLAQSSELLSSNDATGSQGPEVCQPRWLLSAPTNQSGEQTGTGLSPGHTPWLARALCLGINLQFYHSGGRVTHGACLWLTQVRCSQEIWRLLESERGNVSRRRARGNLLQRCLASQTPQGSN